MKNKSILSKFLKKICHLTNPIIKHLVVTKQSSKTENEVPNIAEVIYLA